MRHIDGTFSGWGGLTIYWQAWRAEARPTRAQVVIVHGAGEHSGRYARLAGELSTLGFDVWSLDHRGHGRSAGRRAIIDRFDHALADIDALVDRVRAADAERPLLLLGHSLGGLIALLYALDHGERLDGLVLSAPALVADAASPLLRASGRLLSVLAPGLPVYPVDPRAVSRDPAEVAAYRNDPLVHHHRLPARTVAEAGAAIELLPERLPRLTLPLLVLHGSADRIVPPTGGRLAYERAGSSDRAIRLYEGFYHDLFNEPAAERRHVLDDLVAWLMDHSARRATADHAAGAAQPAELDPAAAATS